jgi:AraC-like DNA-binding protein
VQVGDEKHLYDVNNYLLTSVHLPTQSQVIRASCDAPFLCLVMKLDQREMARMMAENNLPAPRSQQPNRGMAVGEATLLLISAFQRLVKLLDHSDDIPILSPLIQKEIIYRLLVGDQGARLRQIASAGSQSNQVVLAIDWLKENFAQQIRIKDLAKIAGMSISSFHNHFRAMTAMSPLQYQKQLRLQEARLLMLKENIDVSTAAFQVGYESPSQFSREYARLFNSPPLRDITMLRKKNIGPLNPKSHRSSLLL